MKVLINRCHGGYGISSKAAIEWLERTNTTFTVLEDDGYHFNVEIDGERCYMDYIERNDPVLLQIFEEKGSQFVSGPFAELEIAEIPDGANYSIGEYDGREWVSDIWIDATLDELRNGLSQEQLDMVSKGCAVKLKS